MGTLHKFPGRQQNIGSYLISPASRPRAIMQSIGLSIRTTWQNQDGTVCSGNTFTGVTASNAHNQRANNVFSRQPQIISAFVF